MTLADQVRVLPAGPGVYRFRDAAGRVIYLGRATSLRSRVGSYFSASFGSPGRGSRRHLRRMIPQVDRIEAVVTASVHEASWLERNLHHRTLPRWNRVRGGAEVPQLIRVVDGARAASIAVVHLTGRPVPVTPGEHLFGPYLGGLRVRTAVTGLRRVWPVAFAGDRLTGSEQELAAVRGIAVADRARLVAGLVATLRGEPKALADTLAQLATRRDAAAVAESYELAGRLRDEMDAIAWVTAVQRVSRLPGEVDPAQTLSGWSDGLLVTWTIRDGALDGWTQRACGATAARRHLDATTPPWREFAAVNAELAARLLAAR